jgi:hypothetical protein
MTSKVNNFSKLASAVGQPLSKLFKTRSDRIDMCELMAATEQEAFLVRFSENIHVCKTLASKDYTSKEIQACWYTAEETQRIHANCSKEIRKMEEETKLKGKKYCPRGLEGHTAGGTALKQENRWLAIDAVLEEQMIQWEEGICDEDAIAEIYYRASSSCQVSANIVGLADYVDACKKEQRAGGSSPLLPLRKLRIGIDILYITYT